MTRYYNSNGVFFYEDNTTEIDEVKKILEEKDLCLAIWDCDGKIQAVQRGKYKLDCVIHCGQAYWVN